MSESVCGIEDRELLLDRKREVLRLLVLLTSGAELLLRAEALGVSHGGYIRDSLGSRVGVA